MVIDVIQEAKGYFYKHYTVYRKSKADKAALLIYPLVSLFSIGILALYLHTSGSPANTIPYIMVGIVSWTFYELCQRSMVYGMTFDIWDWCLKHSMISPAGMWAYIAGNSLFGLASSMFSVLLLTALSIIFFGFNIFSAGSAAALSFLIIFIFAIAVGLGIISLMMAYDKEYLAFVWSTPGIIMLFSGVYYPIDILPEAVQIIAHLLPTTYAIDAMRIVLGLSGGAIGAALLGGFAASIAYLLLFVWTFRRALGCARRTGKTISG